MKTARSIVFFNRRTVRCVTFAKEIAGVEVLGMFGRGSDSEIGNENITPHRNSSPGNS
jgi:NADH dehydrogenase/NADH:ubiquinone oxidoreductase subunit G